jgi:hypothetical protein
MSPDVLLAMSPVAHLPHSTAVAEDRKPILCFLELELSYLIDCLAKGNHVLGARVADVSYRAKLTRDEDGANPLVLKQPKSAVGKSLLGRSSESVGNASQNEYAASPMTSHRAHSITMPEAAMALNRRSHFASLM